MTEWNYETIRRLARELGVKVEELLALGPDYDPFYMGRPSDVRKARWAKRIWDWILRVWKDKRREIAAIGYSLGERPHLRGIHYVYLTGHRSPKTYNGRPYLGTHADWRGLMDGFVRAKIHGLVPFGEMLDRKHPPVTRYLERTDDNEVIYGSPAASRRVGRGDVRVYLPKAGLGAEMATGLTGEIARSVTKRIPWHHEFWTEKPRNIINQVAERYFANVQDAVGEQTYENVYALLRRAKLESGGRPVRVNYISDYDPRGELMPVSVARKIEWLLANREEFKGMDVKLRWLMLTEEQCERFDLPEAPVKKSESMKRRWEATHRRGVTELDTLESLHPVEFVRILENAVLPYYDSDLIRYIEDYNHRVQRAIAEWNRRVEEELNRRYGAIERKLRRRIAPALKGFKASIKVDLTDELEELKEVVESWEEPEPQEVHEEPEDWLFDSSRKYEEQLRHYKKHRGSS